MRVIVILLISILALSCERVESVPKPENLIPLEIMENIIYDMAIINSARGYNSQTFSQLGINPESYIFEKYEIDSVQFANSTLYYSSSLDTYKQFIDKVKIRIEKEHIVADSIQKEEKRVEDSVRTERAKRVKKEKDSIQAINKAKNIKEGTVIPKKVIEVPPLH